MLRIYEILLIFGLFAVGLATFNNLKRDENHGFGIPHEPIWPKHNRKRVGGEMIVHTHNRRISAAGVPRDTYGHLLPSDAYDLRIQNRKWASHLGRSRQPQYLNVPNLLSITNHRVHSRYQRILPSSRSLRLQKSLRNPGFIRNLRNRRFQSRAKNVIPPALVRNSRLRQRLGSSDLIKLSKDARVRRNIIFHGRSRNIRIQRRPRSAILPRYSRNLTLKRRPGLLTFPRSPRYLRLQRRPKSAIFPRNPGLQRRPGSLPLHRNPIILKLRRRPRSAVLPNRSKTLKLQKRPESLILSERSKDLKLQKVSKSLTVLKNPRNAWHLKRPLLPMQLNPKFIRGPETENDFIGRRHQRNRMRARRLRYRQYFRPRNHLEHYKPLEHRVFKY